MRAVHAESSPDGRRWALNVEVVDERGDHKLVCFTRAEAETEPAKCMSALVDAGLVVYSDDQSGTGSFSTRLFARKSRSLTAS